MKALVADGSTTLGFVLQDEQNSGALKTLEAIEQGIPTIVPAHWCTEVANGLIVAERRKRASQADITEALDLVAALPVETDSETGRSAFSDTAALARQYGLTIYDAAYLELAMRRGALAVQRFNQPFNRVEIGKQGGALSPSQADAVIGHGGFVVGVDDGFG